MTPLPHGSLPSLPDWIIGAIAVLSVATTFGYFVLAARRRRRREAHEMRRHVAGKEARLST